MTRLRPLISMLALLFLCALAPAAAQADGSYDPNGFRLSSDHYTAHENDRRAVITVTRGDTHGVGRAYYVAVGLGHSCGATNCTAVPPGNTSPPDFGPTNGMVEFPDGVGSETFTVPIVDHGFATMNKTVQLSLFNSWPIGRANPNKAVLTILEDDPTAPRDPNNPLNLPVAPTNGNPLSGARFFVDHQNSVSLAARQYPGLHVIADQPGAARYGSFTGPLVDLAVNRYLVRASVEQPGTVPQLATYRLVDNHCGNYTPSPAEVASYHDFITKLARGIGSYRAVLFLEMDSLITTPCLSSQGLTARTNELHDAINVLNANCPHLVVYLDAGAADAIPADQTARLLLRAGVSQIEGFFLNSTHFDWTSREIQFGEQVARLTGGKHFVVNTGDNGRGPLTPPNPVRQGNEVLCNPAGRGLGPKPTTSTGFPNVDAFAWTTNPGESGGACVPGAPATGVYWPAYGLMLIRNAVFTVDSHHAVSAKASSARKPAKKKKKVVKKKIVKKKHKKTTKRAVNESVKRTLVRTR